MKTEKTENTLLTANFLSSLSTGPGIYLMKGAKDEVLYVGKACSLRNRLRSYVNYLTTQSNKTGVLLSKTQRIETTLTMTEKEALLLESSLIKKFKPRYNIILRDDKQYPYLKLTVDEQWPRLVITRKKNSKDTMIFGPFSSASAMWETVKLLNKLFPLRRCKGSNLKMRNRPCLNFQMQKCLAPCTGNVSADEYQQLVLDVANVLSGKNHEVLERLEKKMSEAADKLEFEAAAHYRDKKKALEKTIEKQMVSASHYRDQDVFGFVRQAGSVAIAILRIKSGMIQAHENHFLEEPLDNDSEVLSEFMQRFYEKTSFFPQEIFVPFNPSEKDALCEWLEELRGAKVLLKQPLRGDSVKLVSIAQKNAEQVFSDIDRKNSSWEILAKAIMRDCQLGRLPNRITCMDISNISGEHTVGSVVAFWQGEKDPKNYRHYTIKTVVGPDDYASLAELLDRHLSRIADNLPDLLLIDGGKGQLMVAHQALLNHNLSGQLDILGIAKEKSDEGEKIYALGRKNPLKIHRHSATILLFMRIRDEAHRFGITFHRKLRSKKLMQSPLDLIDGVGFEKRKALLKKLGSVKRIAEADIDQLCQVKGIGVELAKKIRKHFSL
nr:excinuclease ABC subunit UvrC [Desulfobulbaceae bacterium]